LNNSNNIEYIENKASLIKRLMFTYNMLCDLMKIFEFLLNAYPDEFLDIESLNYSRFCNFLKNIASRIIDKFYLSPLIKILEKENVCKYILNLAGGVDNILSLAYSVIGIYNNIYENRNNPRFEKFIKKFA